MKTTRLLGIVAVLATLLTLIVASQAPAAPSKNNQNTVPALQTSYTDSSGIPNDMINGVPASQAQGYVSGPTISQGFTNAPSAKVMTASSAPNSCNDATRRANEHAGAGDVIAWVQNYTHWCYSNWQVTGWTVKPTSYGFPGLYDVQDISTSASWWNKPGTLYTNVRAKLCYLPYFGCAYSSWVNVDMLVNGDGHYSTDGGSTWKS
jgi:hypothetical protein